jgi:hypothetical protein
VPEIEVPAVPILVSPKYTLIVQLPRDTISSDPKPLSYHPDVENLRSLNLITSPAFTAKDKV